MKVAIRAAGAALAQGERREAERRALLALGRFAGRIDGVLVTLTSDLAAREGADVTCRVFVRGRSGWSVEACARDGDPSRAVVNALGRAERAVARHIDRYVAGGRRGRRQAS